MSLERNSAKKKPQNLSMMDMYKISIRSHSNWGIEGYEVPRKYIDSQKLAENRECEELIKKGKQVIVQKKYITKRGNYLDDTLKQVASKLVSPASYKIVDLWNEMGEQAKLQPKIKPSNRETYIDSIYKENKVRPIPAPNFYQHPVKSQKDIKEEKEKWNQRKPKIGEAPNYLNEHQYLGSVTPGPGNYNNRLKDSFQWDLDLKLHKNQFDKQQPAEWIKKHKDLEKRVMKKDDLKAIHPHHLDYFTFEKMKLDNQTKQNDKSSKNLKYFGSSDRFNILKKSKSISQHTPGAGAYNLLALWNGKENKNKKDQNDVKKGFFDFNKINKGISKSIYY